MERIGIRELKENMSRYMKKVKTGEKIIVTDRKKEIAVIMPLVNKAGEEKLYELIQRGMASWAGSIPEGMPERIITKKQSVSSAVIEDRR
ncbi:MAG: type II toxin-antitoxin system prevent-host-death family antitoxin [Deltaproteobacteria bacterium]|nr:type II toxin-antitoxin system prevent-host-death family antitoxin [Deltaproteobacteria bacterium]